MIDAKRTPLDLIDTVYTLAYWMTGSEAATNELFRRTYNAAEIDASETELLKAFRACYLNFFAHDSSRNVPASPYTPRNLPLSSIFKRYADIKLSVLLSEICELNHRDIATIIGKPVGTIRQWLSWGRKSLIKDTGEHVRQYGESGFASPREKTAGLGFSADLEEVDYR
ncbi:MAG: sigma-70 region 4 domain-containing protein [Chlorobium phaeobacteroides]|uniref:RNA polymerase, sigma-24 subunit, ECF subfamily n=1 Tax=Chlorobium phaeobacteroides (strain BS1) TaxID=331678 RepID=B3EQ29_CHLPB|nr:sigma-70 region 4 domain-containing protein [Chlorobium phaeobacteroides]